MGWHGPSEPKLVSIDLTADERGMLGACLIDWGGPAHGTDSLAVALGFAGMDDLWREAERIEAAIAAGEPLTKQDWTRALVSAEIIFASDVFGTGSSWTMMNGDTDEHGIRVLRSLQRKLPAVRRFLGR
ncbi:hypothetical protein [Nocardioides sp. 616]|uniref:hypothetical protein n=1 Tax=Nocardioides sp. 616 TaxID=2268090 RepID=UPI000CE33417|nr:hypothetical protein [Nocardioides sp. 616]